MFTALISIIIILIAFLFVYSLCVAAKNRDEIMREAFKNRRIK